jgi:hypothetical protein
MVGVTRAAIHPYRSDRNESSSGSNFVPSLDPEWLSDAELSDVVGDVDIDDLAPSIPYQPPVPPQPPPPAPPFRSSSEGGSVPPTVDEPEPTPAVTSEDKPTFTEGDNEPTAGEVGQRTQRTSKYWDAQLPEKREEDTKPEVCSERRKVCTSR